MKILYISSAASKKEFEKMQTFYNTDGSNIYGMPEASFKFHNLVIEGLNENGADVYNLIGRPVSFAGYKKVFWKAEKEKKQNVTYHHVSIINLPIVKQIYVSIAMMFNILCWLIKNLNDKEKVIIYDGAYVTMIPIILFCTFLFPCHKVPIICDIYGYMANVEDSRGAKNKLSVLVSKIISKCLAKMHGYVFLTKKMSDVVNPEKKPYLVMEGLVDSVQEEDIEFKNKKNRFIVMYAGALKKEYGLQNLVKGFMKFKKEQVELWLCGAGNYSNEIKQWAKKDKRIKFFGHLSIAEVQEKERKATLLVNPRPTNLQFTQYSFPSKNMEYMASGTPILTTKLPGMPDEYYEHIYTIDGNKASDITNALNEVSQISFKNLKQKGNKAKEFILKQKNKIVQAKRILDFCKNLTKKNNNDTNNLEKNFSKKTNFYFIFLLIMYVFFSRNTLYTSLLISTRVSAILLFVISLPLYIIYLKLFLKNQVSKNNLYLFSLMFLAILFSIIIKLDFIFFNINFLLTITSCFVYSQLFPDSEKFKKNYIIILATISVFSIFNQYIIKNILVILGFFEKLGDTFLVKNNINNVPFLNLITSFVVYVPNYVRNFGIFNEPSFFQFYLIMALVFIEQTKFERRIKVGLGILFVITIISTLSTTGYILVFLYFIMNGKKIFKSLNEYICMVPKEKRKKIFTFILLMFVLFLILLLDNENLMATVKFTFTKIFTKNSSSSTRLNSVMFAVRCIFERPVFGVSATYYLNEFTTTNTMGSLWAIYGFIPFICFMTYIIKFSYNNSNRIWKKSLLFLIIILSINSHFFINNYSFWILVFLGIMSESDTVHKV